MKKSNLNRGLKAILSLAIFAIMLCVSCSVPGSDVTTIITENQNIDSRAADVYSLGGLVTKTRYSPHTPVANARIWITTSVDGKGYSYETYTNSAGRYLFPNIQNPGNRGGYLVKVFALGFKPMQRSAGRFKPNVTKQCWFSRTAHIRSSSGAILKEVGFRVSTYGPFGFTDGWGSGNKDGINPYKSSEVNTVSGLLPWASDEVAHFPSGTTWAEGAQDYAVSVTTRGRRVTPVILYEVGKIVYNARDQFTRSSAATPVVSNSLPLGTQGKLWLQWSGTSSGNIIYDNRGVGYISEAAGNNLADPVLDNTKMDPTWFDIDHGARLQEISEMDPMPAVYLAVEPGRFITNSAAMQNIIKIVMNKYKSYPCVKGFAVDGEFFGYKFNHDPNSDDYGQGIGATNITSTMAKDWEETLIGVAGTRYRLVLKHYFHGTSEWGGVTNGYLGNIIYLYSGQDYTSLTNYMTKAGNGGGIVQWANYFTIDEPGKKTFADVAYQFGYQCDYVSWWKSLGAQSAPYEIATEIASRLNSSAYGGMGITAFWVDFTSWVAFPEVFRPIESSCGSSQWISSQVYVGGDHVSWKGKNWEAKWWTRGEEPGTTGQWGVWKEI